MTTDNLDLDALDPANLSVSEGHTLIQRLRFAESVRDEYVQRLGEAEQHAEARIARLERGLTDIKHVAEHNAAVNGEYVFGIAVAALAAMEEKGR